MNQPMPMSQTATPAATAHAAVTHQYLTFNTSGECLAIGILAIKEIIEFGQITKIPLVPAFVRGVINLRGAVVPVIDLASRLYGSSVHEGKRTCVVIVEVRFAEQLIELGLVVDSVNEVLELQPHDLSPAPTFGASIRTDFIEAMARIGERLVMVLALDKVLSLDEMSSLIQLQQQSHTAQ